MILKEATCQSWFIQWCKDTASLSSHFFTIQFVTDGLPIRLVLLLCINVNMGLMATYIIIRKAHTHTHPFNGPLSGTTRVSRYQKGKPILILLKQETVTGSGISWAICKSAPCSRETTTPALHHSVFTGQMPFLLSNQQRQSTEGTEVIIRKAMNAISNSHIQVIKTSERLVKYTA